MHASQHKQPSGERLGTGDGPVVPGAALAPRPGIGGIRGMVPGPVPPLRAALRPPDGAVGGPTSTARSPARRPAAEDRSIDLAVQQRRCRRPAVRGNVIALGRNEAAGVQWHGDGLGRAPGAPPGAPARGDTGPDKRLRRMQPQLGALATTQLFYTMRPLRPRRPLGPAASCRRPGPRRSPPHSRSPSRGVGPPATSRRWSVSAHA